MKTRAQRDKPGAASPASDRANAPADKCARSAVSDSPRQTEQEQHMCRLGSATNAPGGLPAQLVHGVASLTGEDLSDVQVHRNSTRPAQLRAEAYVQGQDIHVAPGQDHYLPHEAWHIVQQRQGRVRPTGQVGQHALNDDPRLEHEADTMGAKALQATASVTPSVRSAPHSPAPVQRKGGRREKIIDQSSEAKVEPLFVKVIIAGSGYDRWKTHVAAMARPTPPVDVENKKRDTPTVDDNALEPLPSSKRWTRQDDQGSQDEPTHYRKDKDGGSTSQVSFAGPGASTSKGAGTLGGVQDVGSNSIANLVEHVPQVVEQVILDQFATFGYERPVVILIKAHSRGAVAGSRVAKHLMHQIPGAHIELVLVDPVPGPQHEGEDLKIDLSGLSEFTLVYSVASGYGFGFDPQAVFGAKRIIISRQDHSVGLAVGFKHDGKIYKGSNLNSLPQGVFVDINENGQNTEPLIFVASIQQAMKAFDIAFQHSSAKKGDSGRREIVATVLKEYFSRG